VPVTLVDALLVLNRVTDWKAVEPPAPLRSSWVGVETRLGAEPVAVVLGICCAAATAALMFTRPAPCWSAGAPTSVAVLVSSCLTSAGDGLSPLWESR
jgi:hypothetical protein